MRSLWLLLLLSGGVGCPETPTDEERPPTDLPVLIGLARVDEAQAQGHRYELVAAVLDRAEQMEGADKAAYGIAQRRFSIALDYDRPVAEVEATLRDYLALDRDPQSRLGSVAAAYATYPGLVPYFDAVVAELQAMPRTPLVERLLRWAARVRARVESEG